MTDEVAAFRHDMNVFREDFCQYFDEKMTRQTRLFLLGVLGVFTVYTAITLAAVAYLY